MFRGNYVFNKVNDLNREDYESSTMSGVSIKSGILIFVAFISACLSIIILNSLSYLALGFYMAATIATIVLQIIIMFNPLKAKSLSIPYVICEGLIIGVLCDLLELAYPGEGLATAGFALMLTLGIVLAACLLYTKKGVRASSGFVKFFVIMIIGMAIASCFFSITSLILFLTSGISLWGMYLASPLSLLVSVIMVIVASVYVFINIQRADELVKSGVDKKYEWYLAFGIAMTVIWLFLEVLKLLIRLLNRRD